MESSDIQNSLEEIAGLLGRIKDAARYTERVAKVEELETLTAAEGFWDDTAAAQKVISQLKPHKSLVDEIHELERNWHDSSELLELAKEESDDESLLEVHKDTKAIKKQAEQLELKTLLSGEHDSGNSYLAIHPGAGGTESCDWVSMLRRMFLRWAERHGYKVQIIDELPGEETGYKSVTLHVQGPWAYGYLRSEMGVHRLVRISPFDAKGRRHTSFASVDVSPEVEDVEVEINEADLRIDTYRASGAGGQHVNKSDSAVRITHMPTGIVVQCQNQRSQHSNRAQAMKVLISRLHELEMRKREAKMAKIGGEKGDIAFGSQIRSYVLAPYKLAKDHRTDEETGNVDHVLDGDLDRFTEAYLRWRARAAP